MWRIYCDGIEFGRDFASYELAQTVMKEYQSRFPKVKYIIRKARKPRVSQLIATPVKE